MPSSKALTRIMARRANLEALRKTIANMQPITYGDDSWTDDQAEDAIVTVNKLIAMARAVGPEI